MDDLEKSISRHPANGLKKVAERSPHDLGWALGMAKRLGERAEQSRIIKLLLTTPEGWEAMSLALYEDEGKAVIALIKASQKDHETVSLLTEGENK